MRLPMTLDEQRLRNFRALATHPWLGRVYKRLDVSELKIAESFICNQGVIDKGEFERLVNRLFTNGQVKPKHWNEICELLLCANSAL